MNGNPIIVTVSLVSGKIKTNPNPVIVTGATSKHVHYNMDDSCNGYSWIGIDHRNDFAKSQLSSRVDPNNSDTLIVTDKYTDNNCSCQFSLNLKSPGGESIRHDPEILNTPVPPSS